MTVRRSLLTAAALALVLTACAGTTEETAASDATPVAGADVTTEDETAEETPEDGAAADEDGALADGDDAVADEDGAHDEGADEHDESTAHDEADEDHDEADAADGDVDVVVELDMEDIAFSTAELEFAVGDRVRFVFENVGAAPHEALIGDMHLQDEHEEQMMEGGHHDDAGGHHGDLSMISLEPGESGSLVHEFTEAGELWMGCHVPGHWGAGMRTRITVTG